MPRKRGPEQFKKIPPVLQNILASRVIQEAWKGYPLRRRARLVKDLYGVEISYSTLR